MGVRRQGREAAFQLIYQLDATHQSIDDTVDSFFLQMGVPHDVREFALQLVKGTREHLDEIDQLISTYSEHWKLSRMNSVDKNVLRLGVYELLYCPETPTKVIINEAIEVGKKFGADESGAFINGLLDKISNEIR